MSPPPDPTDAAALAEVVSLRLISDDDSEQALIHMLELLVPTIADWGTIHLFEDGAVRKLATIHRDPAKAALAAELHALPAHVIPSEAAVEGLRERASGHLLDPIDDALIDLMAPEPRVRALWTALGMTSMVAVPLQAHGQVFGRLALLMSDASRRFEPGDLALVEELAGRSAILVDTARMIRSSMERLGGLTLLDSLLGEAPLAMAVIDADGRIMHANRAFLGLGPATAPPGHAGLSSEVPSVGAPVAAVVPGLAGDLGRAVGEVLERGVPVEQVVVRQADVPVAEARQFVAGAYPVWRSDGSLLGVGCYLSEVTEARRTAAELEENHARLDLSLAAGGLGSWDWDIPTGTVVWSGALEEIGGLEPGAFGRTAEAFLDFIHPEDRDRVFDSLARAARTGEDVHLVSRAMRADGDVRWIEMRGRAAGEPSAKSRPTRMVGVAADITDRRRMDEIRRGLLEREHAARIESERVSARLAFLDEASTALSSTLDPAEAFAIVTRLVVPRIADACVVDAGEADGNPDDMQIEAAGSIGDEDLRLLRRRRRDAGGESLWSARRTVQSGKAELVADISDEDYRRVALDADHLAVLQRIQPRSAITVPLVARGRALGVITVVATGERRLDHDDLVLMQNLADRAAMAVDNARLFESSNRVARTLQQALLPPALPVIPGIEVEARYRVAERGTEIGGDFYDLFEVGEGAWAVVVGDVCGKGTEAAALTGLMRHTLRATGVRERRPSRVLVATNDVILGQIDDSRFCTALLARMVASPVGALITLASGGHPPPVVLRRSGSVEQVGTQGTLLGVVPDPLITDVDVALGPGDSLVLFTDGVTEARRGLEQFGERRLMEVLGEVTGETAARVADHLLASLDEFQGARSSDDTAILVLRVAAPG